MKTIVGLGNPGRRYVGTPHNLGFEVVERLAARWDLIWRANARHQAQVAEGRIFDRAVILARPTTFMNLSGQSVASLVRQRELGGEDLLIVADDVNLPIGRLRFRPRGSHGGHNGLRSVIERLGYDAFARLRVGIHPGQEVENLTEHVLSRPPGLDRARLEEMADVAASAAEVWLREGQGIAAERFNGLHLFEEET